MSENGDNHEAHESHHPNYIMIWAFLLVLLIVSVFIGNSKTKWIADLAIWGVAFLKSYIVLLNFMHVKYEPKYIKVLVTAGFAVVGILFVLFIPDVLVVPEIVK